MELRAGTPEEAGMDPERVERIRKLGASWIGDENQALVLLAARRGIIFLHESWGKLRPEPDSPPVRTDSIFPWSSISKPVTATCAMVLVDDGLLDINRPVQYYLPEFVGEGKAAVAVRHLLSHTSGLDDVAIAKHQAEVAATRVVPHAEATQHREVNRFLHLSYDAPLSRAPGEAESYCNAGYFLVAEIVRRLTGRSLADFAKERIFDPLGMPDTGFVLRDELRPRLVSRPDDAPGAKLTGLGLLFPLFAHGLNSPAAGTVPWPHGGAYGTARDIAAFGQMFLNGGAYGDARILSRAGVREMTTNQTPGIAIMVLDREIGEASVGYGWPIAGKSTFAFITPTLKAAGSFGHTGYGGLGVWFDPSAELIGVYFSVALKMFLNLIIISNRDLFMDALYAAMC